jgi:DNA mismatch repair ATPase MutL
MGSCGSNEMQPLETIEYTDKSLSITGLFGETYSHSSNQQQFIFLDKRHVNPSSYLYSTLNTFISRHSDLANTCYALFLEPEEGLVYDFDFLDSTVSFLVRPCYSNSI